MACVSSGTMGLGCREGMCRLEFSVCGVMGGGGRINVAVECHTQYRHNDVITHILPLLSLQVFTVCLHLCASEYCHMCCISLAWCQVQDLCTPTPNTPPVHSHSVSYSYSYIGWAFLFDGKHEHELPNM